MPRLLQRFPKLWLESPLLLTYWKQFSLVSREMARPHLKSHKKRVPHGITKTTTEAQEQENILKRDFSAQRPLEKFLTDITEVQCADGKLYVSPIMDCFNGEIVALEMRDNMKKELCIDTVRQLGADLSEPKGSGVPLRSRESIHQRGFSRGAVSPRHGTEPQRNRTLLRQRTDGELFRHA